MKVLENTFNIVYHGRREACGPETAQPTRITVLGCWRWPCLQTVKSAPMRSVLKNRPDLPKKTAAIFSRPRIRRGSALAGQIWRQGRRRGDIRVQ